MERKERKKSPTKPIDTSTNYRLYLKQLEAHVNSPTASIANSTLQT